jgi:hypothetical protein
LIVSSAQEDQSASETVRRTGNGKEWHGAFTLALMETLNHLPVTASAERVFDRVTAKLKAVGLQQDPVLGGLPARRRAPLFGGENTYTPDHLHINVLHTDSADEILLQGGLALGLTPGTELTPTHSPVGGPLRLRITEVQDLLRSRAAVIQGNWNIIRAGDEFEVSRWGAAPEQSLRIYVPPPSPDEQAALRLATALKHAVAAAGTTWVEDPTEEIVTHVLMWIGKEWMLTDRDGHSVSLGPSPATEQILGSMSRKDGPTALFMNVPPSNDVLNSLVPVGKDGEGRAQLIQDAEDSHYVLAGRLTDRQSQYAWILRAARPAGGQKSPVSLPLPARTAWGRPPFDNRPCPDGGLKTCLPLLSKIFHWLNVESPADDRRFPYRLGFAPVSSSSLSRADRLVAGTYRLFLESDESTIAAIQAGWGIQARYVYVFVIDQEGKSTLLFPNAASKEREHLVPRLGSSPARNDDLFRIPLGDSAVIEVHAPFGSDTYILLSSAREIPRIKELVETDAVESSARRMRGQADWSISRRFVQSMPGSAP